MNQQLSTSTLPATSGFPIQEFLQQEQLISPIEELRGRSWTSTEALIAQKMAVYVLDCAALGFKLDGLSRYLVWWLLHGLRDCVEKQVLRNDCDQRQGR